MNLIKLQNIKGIKEMIFPFPEKKGIYVLTGINGCGKTSLLIALCRLGDKMAFKNYHVNTNNNIKIDEYNKSSITYSINGEEVIYKRKGLRWVPTPRENNKLISQFPFSNTLFISTTGIRFFSQELFNSKNTKINDVNANLTNAMNSILGTDKFNHLKFIAVKNKKGRQRYLHRNNKLYVIKDPEGNFYSEQNFSLGERLLLNTLDLLENISKNTLLLIDEVELALHPIAQIKFYDYLEKQAHEKNLAVIISTHSSSLIKHASNRLFLEKENTGVINVINNCYPSYILRDIASPEDRQPDFIFFVEDVMAMEYLSHYIRRFLIDEKLLLDLKIIPVGGYEQVVKLLESFPTLNFKKNRTQAFLDNDVLEKYNEWESKGNNRTDSENRKFRLFNENKNYISYLNITPELGVWEWIENNPNKFKIFFDNKHGQQTFDINESIAQTSSDEALHKRENNKREWAKGCFMNFKERIHNQNTLLSEQSIVSDMIECYVYNNYDLNRLKDIFYPLLRRK